MATPSAPSGDHDLIMNTSASGNCSFELVLSPARVPVSPRVSKLLQSPAPPQSPLSLELIQSKLKTAEDNRDRLIDEKLEKIKEHDKRASEVRKELQKEMQEEAQRTLEMSQQKLATAEELRQQRLEQLVEKLKEHDNRIEQVRCRMAARETDSTGEDLQHELDSATANRDLVAEAIQQKQQNGTAKENVIP